MYRINKVVETKRLLTPTTSSERKLIAIVFTCVRKTITEEFGWMFFILWILINVSTCKPRILPHFTEPGRWKLVAERVVTACRGNRIGVQNFGKLEFINVLFIFYIIARRDKQAIPLHITNRKHMWKRLRPICVWKLLLVLEYVLFLPLYWYGTLLWNLYSLNMSFIERHCT